MDEELLGSVKLFAGQFIPQGYLECNGQILIIPHNEALYSLLGNTFGGDIRSNNFGLPNLTPPIEGMKYIISNSRYISFKILKIMYTTIPDNVKPFFDRVVNLINEYYPFYYVTHHMYDDAEYFSHHCALGENISNGIMNLIVSDRINPSHLKEELSKVIDLSKFKSRYSKNNDFEMWFEPYLNNPKYL